MSTMGHNNPPTPLDDLKERGALIRDALNQAMMNAPVVTSQEDAVAYTNAIKSAKSFINEVDDKRKESNKPFDQMIKDNNAAHRAVSDPLTALIKVASPSWKIS